MKTYDMIEKAYNLFGEILDEADMSQELDDIIFKFMDELKEYLEKDKEVSFNINVNFSSEDMEKMINLVNFKMFDGLCSCRSSYMPVGCGFGGGVKEENNGRKK